MWPFSKIAALEERIKALEDRDYAPKMYATSDAGRRPLSLFDWYESMPRVTHEAAIRAILKHLNLTLRQTSGTEPEVRVEPTDPMEGRIVIMSDKAKAKSKK